MQTVVGKKRREGKLVVASEIIEPRFRDRGELSFRQLTDPDYALKQLEKLNGGKLSITCSKCHHCR